jgi:hypothetical protein
MKKVWTLSVHLIRDAVRCGSSRKAQSGSALNHRQTGCEIVGGEPQGWTLCRTVGISIRRDAAPDYVAVHTARDRAAGLRVSVGSESRRRFAYLE